MTRRVVVSGTMVGPQVAHLSYRAWGGKMAWIPTHGTARLEGTFRRLEPHLLKMTDRYGPVELVGHSQGALHAMRFAIEHPDRVERMVGVAGPYLGTPWSSGPPVVGCVKDMAPGSKFLQGLRDGASSYDGEVILIGGTRDRLVPLPSAHGIDGRKITVDHSHTSLMRVRLDELLLG